MSLASRSSDQIIRALLVDLHELQLERASAAAIHATNASQIANLTANLQDAIMIQQQLQTKVQLLEYGLLVERRENERLRAQVNGNGNGGANSNGTDASAPASTPATGSSSHQVDATLFAAYLAALRSPPSLAASSSSSHPSVDRSPSGPRSFGSKSPMANSVSFATSNTALSNATTALPNIVKPRSSRSSTNSSANSSDSTSSGDNLSFSYEKSPSKVTPVKSSSNSSSSLSSSTSPLMTGFKPPSLNANMFMPPTEAEIAAEIALAKSPPVIQPNLPRAKSDQSLDQSPLHAERKSTVYNYSNGTPDTTPSKETGAGVGASASVVPASGNGTTYTYSNDGSSSNASSNVAVGGGANSLSSTAVDLSNVQITLTPDAAPASQQAPPPKSSATTVLNGLAPSGSHARVPSSSSAFSPLIPSSSSSSSTSVAAAKQWRPRLQLRAHLDSVRHVSWDRSEDVTGANTWLLSTSEDGTAQLWNLTQPLLAAATTRSSKAAAAAAAQPVPVHTYRGHIGTVTSAVLSSASKSAYTAGVDGQLIHWSLPPEDVDPYGSHGCVAAYKLATLKHADAVWTFDLCERRGLLVVGVADGTIVVWRRTNDTWVLERTVTLTSENQTSTPSSPSPSTIVLHPTLSHAFVGSIDGALTVWDVDTGAVVRRFVDTPLDSSTSSSSTPSRITQLVLGLNLTPSQVITSHVDASLRFWDIDGGARIAHLAAHRAIVSTIAYDNEAGALVSGSHDESIRVWSASDRKIRQVLDTHQTHRLKFDEVRQILDENTHRSQY